MGIFTRTICFLTTFAALSILTACDNSASTGNASPNTVTAADVITVTEPRIRATAPGQKVSGAFLSLTNGSATPYALVSARFSAADAVEIHETSMNGKMMRMMQVEQIDIPANGVVELKPGSYHIMLMGLNKALKAGTTETLTLMFSDDSQVTVQASVGDVNQ